MALPALLEHWSSLLCSDGASGTSPLSTTMVGAQSLLRPKDPAQAPVDMSAPEYMRTQNTKGLVVVSHPDQGSFNHALAKAVARSWSDAGVTTAAVDLHSIGFDPVLGVQEARGGQSDDPIVREQIELLTSCDMLAVVHPNCWGAPPAMMKGWMDRVFAPGAAYAFAKGEDNGEAPLPLLTGKRALVLHTSNTTLERDRSTFGDPLERIWRDCLLNYCGFSRVDRLVFRVMATSTVADRQAWLAEAARSARDLLFD